MKPLFSIGAFAIIQNPQKQVLLVLRNDIDFWNLPGGAVESWEAPREAVVREVKEETGYVVEVVRLIGIYSKPYSDDLVFSFECKIISWSATLNDEARDIKFFSIENIPENTLEKHLERILDFYQNPTKPIFKKQFKKK